MGPIDSPAVHDPGPVDWVIPSDKRDFSRSTPDWAITFPRDTNIADDMDPFIKQVQQMMKNPAGLGLKFFAYAGPIDGLTTGKWYSHLLNVLIQFGWALKKKFPNKSIPTIVSGGKLNRGAFQNAVSIALKKETPKEKTEEVTKENSSIKAFQLFFSKDQPVIGKLYSGDVDGKMNDELAAAAQAAESAIGKAIESKSVHGVLFSDNKFNTSVDDLKGALLLVKNHIGNKKISFLDSKSRILILSSFIND